VYVVLLLLSEHCRTNVTDSLIRTQQMALLRNWNIIYLVFLVVVVTVLLRSVYFRLGNRDDFEHNIAHKHISDFDNHEAVTPIVSSIEHRLKVRQLRRKGRLAAACAFQQKNPSPYMRNWKDVYEANGEPSEIEFYFLRVDDDRRLLYCDIAKIASSNWKRTLIYLSGKTSASSPSNISGWDAVADLGEKILPRLSTFKPDEIRFRLSTYFKFVFVREPFDRLQSAYVDKFGSRDNDLFNKDHGRDIIRQYRKNPTNESLLSGNDVRFDEFVSHLTDPRILEKEKQKPRHWYSFDQHWRQYYHLCHPCLVHYDFIGKYETQTEDVEHVMKLVGVFGLAKFPSSESSRFAVRDVMSADDSLRRNFANISSVNLQRLLALYGDDFLLFGYSYPVFAHRFAV